MAGPVDPPLHQTYELYLTSRGGETRFEPLTCPPADVHQRVQRILVDLDLGSIEVRRGGEHQFRVGSFGRSG